MFEDVGGLEVVALVIIGILVFGPDKLPKLIQDVTGFIRKVRAFSDSAKEDIRNELGPQFKDFEFEDLNPKAFVRKQLTSGEDSLGLKEIRSSLDFRGEMAEFTDVVKGRDSAAGGSPGTPDKLRKHDGPTPGEPPPFDSDAT